MAAGSERHGTGHKLNRGTELDRRTTDPSPVWQELGVDGRQQ
jgi:hypothetical protein